MYYRRGGLWKSPYPGRMEDQNPKVNVYCTISYSGFHSHQMPQSALWLLLGPVGLPVTGIGHHGKKSQYA